MIFKQIAKFSVRFRWLIIIFWLAAVPLAVKTLPSLSNVTKSDNSAFLPANSASQHASDLASPFQGGSGLATSTMVASRDSGPLTAADNAAIDRAEQAVRDVHGVKNVRDQGTSKDGQVREIMVAVDSAGFSPTGLSIVGDIRHAMNSVSVPGLSFHLTGTLASTADSNKSNNSSRDSTQKYTLIFIVVLLLLVYRSALAPLITLVPAALSLAVAGPVIAESTKIGVQISPITQLLLIVLILGAGTDYGLFLVFRVREELRRGLAPKDAVIQALTKVGEAITFSAFTVGAALLSLLLASFGFYKGLGPALAIGLGILLLSALTLLPALLTIFGRASFWPSKSRQGSYKQGVWGRIADRVIKHPVVTLVVGILLLVSLASGLIGYKTGGFNNAAPPAANTDSGQGSKIITDHFPTSSNNPQLVLMKFNKPVWDNLNEVSRATDLLSKSKEFSSVSGPLNPGGVTVPTALITQLHKQLGPPSELPAVEPKNVHVPPQMYMLYRALSTFISPDGKTVEYFATMSAGPSGSSGASNAMPAARTRVQSVASSVGATDSGILSQDAYTYDISHTATSDLKLIVPIVLLIIALLLAILLRSLVAPWYLIASVGLSYLATLGFAMTVFVHLNKSSDGLNFILPFLLFVFSMALGEDYNILVMTRIREEAHTAPSLREAVVKAIGITGTTVTSAGLILAGTFTVLGLSGGGNAQVEQIGFSIAFGILLDTFFVRTLLVPSVAVLLGRWNWWPSALSRPPKAPRHEPGSAQKTKLVRL